MNKNTDYSNTDLWQLTIYWNGETPEMYCIKGGIEEAVALARFWRLDPLLIQIIADGIYKMPIPRRIQEVLKDEEFFEVGVQLRGRPWMVLIERKKGNGGLRPS